MILRYRKVLIIIDCYTCMTCGCSSGYRSSLSFCYMYESDYLSNTKKTRHAFSGTRRRSAPAVQRLVILGRQRGEFADREALARLEQRASDDKTTSNEQTKRWERMRRAKERTYEHAGRAVGTGKPWPAPTGSSAALSGAAASRRASPAPTAESGATFVFTFLAGLAEDLSFLVGRVSDSA